MQSDSNAVPIPRQDPIPPANPIMPDGSVVPNVADLHLPELHYPSLESQAALAAIRARRHLGRIGAEPTFPRRHLCFCGREEVFLYADGTRRNTRDGSDHVCSLRPMPKPTREQVEFLAKLRTEPKARPPIVRAPTETPSKPQGEIIKRVQGIPDAYQ